MNHVARAGHERRVGVAAGKSPVANAVVYGVRSHYAERWQSQKAAGKGYDTRAQHELFSQFHLIVSLFGHD